MILLKITIIHFILWVVDLIVIRIGYARLDLIDRMIEHYPTYLHILAFVWALLSIGWVGCLIATIILW